ncbi:MAG: DUF4296 domain-containing protein [Bacteroidetes bacterium]|nr:DUF4296 domain-containing protein [Bacteroidota bacterium]
MMSAPFRFHLKQAFSAIGFVSGIMLLGILVSCKPIEKDTVPKPDIVLSENQMVNLIYDATLAESGMNFKRSKGQDFSVLHDTLYDLILAKHNISLDLFEENLSWYNQHPENMEVIYNKVIDKLQALKTEVMSDTAKKEPAAEKSLN